MKLSKDNCYKIKKVDVIVEEGNFNIRPIIVLCDEMSEVMEGKDYRAVQDISNAISSIARLGRAASVHLVLAPLPWNLELIIKRDKKYSLEQIALQIDNLQKKIVKDKYQLPQYFENMEYSEIIEHIEYLKNIYNVINSSSYNEGEFKILWKDLMIGDILDDCSVCTYIGEWSKEKCYKLYSNDSSIIASYNHLFLVRVEKDNICLNNTFQLSSVIRKILKEDNEMWVCVEDLYFALENGAKLTLLDYNYKPQKHQINQIDILDNEIQCRCIQTTSGMYGIR